MGGAGCFDSTTTAQLLVDGAKRPSLSGELTQFVKL